MANKRPSHSNQPKNQNRPGKQSRSQNPNRGRKQNNPKNSNQETFPVDENDTDVMVTVELDGEDMDCEILTIFTLNTQDYIVLMPVDQNGDPIDDTLVYIYRYFEDKDGNPSIDNIQTDEEYNRVNHYFRQLADRDLRS